jgi:hypothetical protein
LQVHDPDPSGDAPLRSYKEEHYRAMGRAAAATGFPDFVADLRRTGVLLLGDHHADDDLHREQLRLIEELRAEGFALSWLVECVGEEDGDAVAAYTRNDLDLDGLLAALGPRGSWLDLAGPFDGAFYRALLAGARRSSEPLRPIETFDRPPLDMRDPLITAAILRARQEWRSRALVVVVGHAHLLGRGHIATLLPFPATILLPRLSREASASVRDLATRSDERFVRLISGAYAFLPQEPRPAP